MVVEGLDLGEAKFNAGIAKLQRIHWIKIQLIQATIEHNWEGMPIFLAKWFSELAERLPEDSKEFKEGESYEKTINALLQAKNMRVKGSTGLLSKSLLNYERYLSRLEFKLGMSMPLKDDPRRAILKR